VLVLQQSCILLERARLIESFDWAVGVAFEPQCSDCRKSVAKMFSFVTIIDDIYDVYGTLDMSWSYLQMLLRGLY
jgi:hypothetical protein